MLSPAVDLSLIKLARKQLMCVTQKDLALFANSAYKVIFLDVKLVQRAETSPN